MIRHSSNRYLTTVRIAYRAKQRRFDDFDGLLDDSMVKPVQRAIIELSDEQDQPDLLPGCGGFRGRCGRAVEKRGVAALEVDPSRARLCCWWEPGSGPRSSGPRGGRGPA